jgi:hypothetical protein
MTHLPASPLSKPLGKAASPLCVQARVESHKPDFARAGALFLSKRLMGRLAYPIIGAEHCIIASKAAENKEDY